VPAVTCTPVKRLSPGNARLTSVIIEMAAGDSDRPVRVRMPTVRVNVGSLSGRKLRLSSGARLAASADIADTPTPRASRVAIVEVFETRYRGSLKSWLSALVCVNWCCIPYVLMYRKGGADKFLRFVTSVVTDTCDFTRMLPGYFSLRSPSLSG